MASLYENEKSVDFYREAFVTLRNKVYFKIRNMGSIRAREILEEEYDQICADAAGGDEVAQDFLSYWFKNGSEVVEENIETGMKWQILAGANGNKFAIEKMFVFLNFAYDRIFYLRDFEEISEKFDIYKDNYQFVLGKIICDALVDELLINPLRLAQEDRTKLEFNDVSMRKFDKAVDKVLPKVIEFLRK